MATNILFPDFSGLRESSRFFYNLSVALDDAARDYLELRFVERGLTVGQQAKIHAALLRLVDEIYLTSGAFDHAADLQERRLG